jgi:hypothetical protein
MNCALRQNPKILRKSHIIPEFLYAPLYDGKHRATGIHGLGRRGSQYLQKGVADELLCDDCEQFLNDNYEKPFKQYWIDQCPLPKSIGPKGVVVRNIDYSMFKLFHLSILFRASVAATPTFGHVALGPHEQILRKMVLNRDPGTDSDYSILAFVVVDRNGAPLWRLILPPFPSRFQSHRFYMSIFGACSWCYKVSKHPSSLLKQAGLHSDGTLWLVPRRWEELPAIQEISKMLRKLERTMQKKR